MVISTMASSSDHDMDIKNDDILKLCETFPMTSSQQQLCKDYPKLFSFLFTAVNERFQHYCHREFKHERWNCTNINLPLLGPTQPFLTLETKEAAFVYALASATVVHSIAKKCVDDEYKLSYCGCDNTPHNKTLGDGETWGCSPDIHFSMNFTKRLLDRRVENATGQHKTFVLHNNKIGRLVVKENMKKTCRCLAKSCSLNKECKMMLPEMDDVAKELKKKYKEALFLGKPSTQQEKLNVKEDDHTKGKELIYYNNSIDYCTAMPAYGIAGIAERQCTLDTSHASSSHHCNNLCCDHGTEDIETKESRPCNCKFVWCCRVECETCYIEKTRHVCKSKAKKD